MIVELNSGYSSPVTWALLRSWYSNLRHLYTTFLPRSLVAVMSDAMDIERPEDQMAPDILVTVAAPKAAAEEKKLELPWVKIPKIWEQIVHTILSACTR